MSILLQTNHMKDYFHTLKGIKIQQSPYLYQQVRPFLHSNLRILNLQKNNLENIDQLLLSISKQSQLEFLNLSHNRIVFITKIIEDLPCLKEIHVSYNLISSIQDISDHASQLRILDLGHNLVDSFRKLSGVDHLKCLEMLNLEGNRAVEGHWKSKWEGVFDINIIYQMSNFYVRLK